jgi:hypothetical protein
VQAGAGNGGEGVAAGGRLGNSWRAWGRAAGEGNRAGAGGERRMDVIPAGGGAAVAAERWPGAKYCWRQEGGGRVEEHVLEEEEETEGVRGTCLEISRISGTSQ